VERREDLCLGTLAQDDLGEGCGKFRCERCHRVQNRLGVLSEEEQT
jgi:hypothetical protein